MASGKETPRQKMIGMMYLVLTALLALNVSKEIVNAFVKLNDKLEDSNKILATKAEINYLDLKTAAGLKHSAVVAKPWLDRADKLRKLFSAEFNYVLYETNALLQETEGKNSNWLEKDKRSGDLRLKPLMDVESKDDYDAATRLFVGGDPVDPNKRGKDLKKRLHALRDEVCTVIGSYSIAGTNYVFDAAKIKNYDPKIPSTHQELKRALKSANPADTSVLLQVYRTLSYPENLSEYGETVSWQGAMFDHAPVVAAAAILTSLRTDIKTAESLTMEHFAGKVGKLDIVVNKIEPVAFAPKGYLNVGDTMPLRIMIAAYDSNNIAPIRYSETQDLTNANEITGPLTIKATTPGIKTIYGNIAVRQKGELLYKPWSFQYEVGQPTASISQTDLNILYAGIDNNVSATASGYSQADINLSGSNVTIQKKNGGGYTVKVPASMVGRKIYLGVSAKGKSIGSMEFRIRSVPRPLGYLGTLSSLDNAVTKSQLISAVNAGIALRYDDSAPIICPYNFTECDVEIMVNGAKTPTEKLRGGTIPPGLKQKILGMRSGSVLNIYNIKGSGKPGIVRVPSIRLTVL